MQLKPATFDRLKAYYCTKCEVVQYPEDCTQMLYCTKCDEYTNKYQEPVFFRGRLHYRHWCSAFATLSGNRACDECDAEVTEVRAVKCPHCRSLFIDDLSLTNCTFYDEVKPLVWAEHLAKVFNKVLFGNDYEPEKGLDICEVCDGYTIVNRTCGWIICDYCLEEATSRDSDRG